MQNNYYNSPRLQLGRYPKFEESIFEKVCENILDDLPQKFAKEIMLKLENSDFELNEESFILELKDYVLKTIKKVFYFDDDYVCENVSASVILKLGPEQTFILMQFVMAYIALHN